MFCFIIEWNFKGWDEFINHSLLSEVVRLLMLPKPNVFIHVTILLCSCSAMQEDDMSSKKRKYFLHSVPMGWASDSALQHWEQQLASTAPITNLLFVRLFCSPLHNCRLSPEFVRCSFRIRPWLALTTSANARMQAMAAITANSKSPSRLGNEFLLSFSWMPRQLDQATNCDKTLFFDNIVILYLFPGQNNINRENNIE